MTLEIVKKAMQSCQTRVCLVCGSYLAEPIEEHRKSTGHCVFLEGRETLVCLRCENYFEMDELTDGKSKELAVTVGVSLLERLRIFTMGLACLAS